MTGLMTPKAVIPNAQGQETTSTAGEDRPPKLTFVSALSSALLIFLNFSHFLTTKSAATKIISTTTAARTAKFLQDFTANDTLITQINALRLFAETGLSKAQLRNVMTGTRTMAMDAQSCAS